MTRDELFKCIVYLYMTLSCSDNPTTVFKTVLLSFLGAMFSKVGSEDPDGSFRCLLGVDILFSMMPISHFYTDNMLRTYNQYKKG